MRLTPAQFPERTWLVSPFLSFVLRRLRLVLCTGFLRDEPWSLRRSQALLLHQFGQATPPRRLVVCYDASPRPLLALAITTCLRGSSRWSRDRPAFLPASVIDDQSLHRGRCISLFTRGWELAQGRTQHRDSSYQGSLLVDHPPIVIGFDRTCRTLDLYIGIRYTLHRQANRRST